MLKSVAAIFNSYLQEKGYETLPSTPSLLNTLLCSYWPSLRTLKGDEYTARTLCNHRQLLRTYIMQSAQIDIFNAVELKDQNMVFDNYTKSLKQKGKGTVRHFRETPLEDMRKVAAGLTLNNPIELQLLTWWYIVFL